MVAILSFVVVIALFLTASRVATVALTATGMSQESARFQARSALMGVGYTTHEAEDVVSHPIRRRIVLWLMTLGNAGIITVVTSLVIGFIGIEREQSLRRIAVLVAGLILVLLLASWRGLDRLLTRLTARLLTRFTHLDTTDYGNLLRLSHDYGVIELYTREDDWLVGRPLADLHLGQEGVAILGIQRDQGEYLGAPHGTTEIHPGDTVVAYGRLPLLAELDQRHADQAGERAHFEAVAEQQTILEDIDTSGGEEGGTQ